MLTFNDYLNESLVYKLNKEFPKPGYIFRIHDRGKDLYLDIILVPYKDRGKGKGTKFLKRLIELAKEEGKDIYLNVSDMYAEDDNLKGDDLVNFYKKFGFKPTKNFKLNKEMVYKVGKNEI
jgi:GNAT superfamily N-acetyltransferase